MTLGATLPCGSVHIDKHGDISKGDIAQLGEHLPCKQGVESSSLFVSMADEDSPPGRKTRGWVASPSSPLPAGGRQDPVP